MCMHNMRVIERKRWMFENFSKRARVHAHMHMYMHVNVRIMLKRTRRSLNDIIADNDLRSLSVDIVQTLLVISIYLPPGPYPTRNVTHTCFESLPILSGRYLQNVPDNGRGRYLQRLVDNDVIPNSKWRI